MDANAPACPAPLEEGEAGELWDLGAAKVEVELAPAYLAKQERRVLL